MENDEERLEYTHLSLSPPPSPLVGCVAKAYHTLLLQLFHPNVRTSWLFQEGYYEATTRLLRGLLHEVYYEATTRSATGLLRSTGLGATTRLLRGYNEATTRPLPGYYEATTRLLLGAARAPLGQQHSSSSTARLTAPLVLAARARRVGKNLGRGDINWANDNRPKMPK